MKKSALNISLTALSASLICVCAWVAIPIGGVPMTLQTFGVAFCGYLLGARRGAGATMLYLTLGAVGLPVFAGFGGSLSFLIGPTGGFLFGFPVMALLCGLASKRKHIFCELVLMICGLMICHLAGTLWFAYVSGISVMQAFFVVSLPYVAKDMLCLLGARMLFFKLRKRHAGISRFL